MSSLRPVTFDGIIGNDKLKLCLSMSVSAAKSEDRPVGHTLLQGHYGCGKTTFAGIIAHMMGGKFIETNAAAIKTYKDLIAILSNVRQYDTLFIDEIHRLKKKHEEVLYTVMEDFKLPINSAVSNIAKDKIDSGVFNIDVPKFTLIGATTDIGGLSGPLLSRFKLKHFVSLYTVEEIQKIVVLNAKKLNISFSDDASLSLAKRCKLVPRIANNMLEWLRDYSIYKKKSIISLSDVDDAMKLLDVDERGFDKNDRTYLEALIEMQPIGVQPLAARTGLSIETITKYIEPYLLHTGVIRITGSGRMMTDFELEGTMTGIDYNTL